MSLILETPRLILRPFDKSDIQAVVAISTNPGVACHMQDMIYDTKEKAEAWIDMLHRLYAPAAPLVVLAIVPKLGSEPVGYIGVHPKEELDNAVEILYAVMDEAKNRGYATEAGKALMNWCFENKQVPFIAAIIKPDNIPSARVAEKLGFERAGDRIIPYNGNETFFYYCELKSPNKNM